MTSYEDRIVWLITWGRFVETWYADESTARRMRDAQYPGCSILARTVRAAIEHSGAEAGRVSYAIPATI